MGSLLIAFVIDIWPEIYFECVATRKDDDYHYFVFCFRSIDFVSIDKTEIDRNKTAKTDRKSNKSARWDKEKEMKQKFQNVKINYITTN